MIYYIIAKSESDINDTILNLVHSYPKEVYTYSPSQKTVHFNDGLINDEFFFVLESEDFENNGDLVIDIDDFKEMWCIK